MAPPRRPTHTGLDSMIVQIEEIDAKGNAHCIDQFGRQMAIPITITRAKGARPAVGDQWIIDRTVGNRWSFAAVLNTVPPEVTGTRSANPALANLIEVLAALGFVTDATTEGSAGGGGGVTDHGALTGLADDDHPQYLRQTEADALYDILGAASGAVIAHEGDPDPHPQYLTEDEADALYEPEGQAVVEVATHVGQADPHTQYAKESDLGTAAAADLDSDSTMAANSASRVPSQSAAKGYTDQRIPTHRGATSFSGVYLSTKTGIVASAVVAGTAGSGRRIYVPIYLPAATYGSLAIVTTAAGTSTWRLGVYNHISGDQTIPGTVLLDAGTISTAGSTGVPTAITGLSIVIPADDWYYLAVQVDAYTTNPTVVAHAGVSGQSTIPFLGWPEQRASYLRGFCGYQDWGVSTGSLNTARSITNNTSTGLSYAQDVPRIWIGA